MFWKRTDRLETELRASRPEPRDEFLQSVVRRVESRRPRVTAFRLAFAGGLTAVGLIVLGAFGGLGYAGSTASVVKAPVKVVSKVVAPKKSAPAKSVPTKSARASADAQYGNGFTLCHRPPGNPSNAHTITVGSEQARQAHLAHGDTDGPCP